VVRDKAPEDRLGQDAQLAHVARQDPQRGRVADSERLGDLDRLRGEAATAGVRVGIGGDSSGVTVPLMLSNGRVYSLPASLKDLERRHRDAVRVVSRRRRGSSRHARALQEDVALQARAARIRRHWQHEVTSEIARAFNSVKLEDLGVQRMMTRLARLNLAVLNVGWHGIETRLACKIAGRGGELIYRDPAHTSQTCSSCGARDECSRRSQAHFVCTSCGHSMNADLNAATNIERGLQETSEAEHVLVTRGGNKARTCRRKLQ
jgi:transposase